MKEHLIIGVLAVIGTLCFYAPNASADAITERGTATVSVQNNTGPTFSTITLAKPTGVVSGDVMVATILSWVSSGSPAAPSLAGWSSVTSNVAGTTQVTMLRRVADGSEGSSFAFAFSPSAELYMGGLIAYFNVNTSTPVDVGSSNHSSGASLCNPGNLVTTVNNDLLLSVCFDFTGTAAWTAPTGYESTPVFTDSSIGREITGFNRLVASPPGTYSSQVNTANSTVWLGAAVALEPAADTPTPTPTDTPTATLTATPTTTATATPTATPTSTPILSSAPCPNLGPAPKKPPGFGIDNGCQMGDTFVPHAVPYAMATPLPKRTAMRGAQEVTVLLSRSWRGDRRLLNADP